jgi:excisionase family DNA binding protein
MRKVDGIEYYTIEEAAEHMGCSTGWVRRLLHDGELKGTRMGKRMLLVTRSSARHAARRLTTRSKSRRHLAVRPAAVRKYVQAQRRQKAKAG